MGNKLNKQVKKLQSRRKAWDEMRNGKEATTRPGSMNRKKKA